METCILRGDFQHTNIFAGVVTHVYRAIYFIIALLLFIHKHFQSVTILFYLSDTFAQIQYVCCTYSVHFQYFGNGGRDLWIGKISMWTRDIGKSWNIQKGLQTQIQFQYSIMYKNNMALFWVFTAKKKEIHVCTELLTLIVQDFQFGNF